VTGMYDHLGIFLERRGGPGVAPGGAVGAVGLKEQRLPLPRGGPVPQRDDGGGARPNRGGDRSCL